MRVFSTSRSNLSSDLDSDLSLKHSFDTIHIRRSTLNTYALEYVNRTAMRLSASCDISKPPQVCQQSESLAGAWSDLGLRLKVEVLCKLLITHVNNC